MTRSDIAKAVNEVWERDQAANRAAPMIVEVLGPPPAPPQDPQPRQVYTVEVGSFEHAETGEGGFFIKEIHPPLGEKVDQ